MPTNYDWDFLDKTVNPRNHALKYDDVKDRFQKVAFDVYKQEGSNKLWELRTEDGTQYLVALYDDSDNDLVVESQDEKDWTATADTEGENVTLSYRNTPIARFASSKYQYKPQEAEKFAKFLEVKASDRNFLNNLLDTMPEQKKLAVLKLLQEGVN